MNMKKIVFLSLFALASLSLLGMVGGSKKKQTTDSNKMQETPMGHFEEWFKKQSQKVGKKKASCFVLATVRGDCRPSTRVMELKEFDREGFTMVGDLHSQQFHDLNFYPYAAATFLWSGGDKQVNMMGRVYRIDQNDAERIFRTLDRKNQITAFLFSDLQNADSNEEALLQHKQAEQEFQGKAIPMPDTWGGYRFVPERIEFWQRGSNNINARVVYQVSKKGQWDIDQFF